MRRLLSFLLCVALGVGVIELSDSASAKTKKSTKKTTRTTSSTSSSGAKQTQTITLIYTSSDSYTTLSLSPSGNVTKSYYSIQYMNANTPPDQWGAYKLSQTQTGSWTLYSRTIGNGAIQYYYEISINGDKYYYVKGSDRLFIGFSAFINNRYSDSYKLTDKIPQDRRNQYR